MLIHEYSSIIETIGKISWMGRDIVHTIGSNVSIASFRVIFSLLHFSLGETFQLVFGRRSEEGQNATIFVPLSNLTLLTLVIGSLNLQKPSIHYY